MDVYLRLLSILFDAGFFHLYFQITDVLAAHIHVTTLATTQVLLLQHFSRLQGSLALLLTWTCRVLQASR